MKTLRTVLEDVAHCERMWASAHLSASEFYIACSLDSTRIPSDSNITVRDVRDCRSDLEKAYFVRLFAVFEWNVRDYWHDVMNRSTDPMVSVLIDRVASACYMESRVLEKVHELREYRNHLVHGASASHVDISEARSAANTFLSRLVGKW